MFDCFVSNFEIPVHQIRHSATFRAAIIMVTYVGWVKRQRTHHKIIVDGPASLDPSYSLKFLSIELIPLIKGRFRELCFFGLSPFSRGQVYNPLRPLF